MPTNQFPEKVLDFFKKIGVPVPTQSIEEIQRLRLSFRNETDLYKRKCDKTGKNIITNYPPSSPYKIYDREVWWSDCWNALDYGQNYDFSKNFFEQFSELEKKVPKANIYVVESENSTYTNYASHNKNCYLLFGSWFNEDCLYGNTYYHSISCVDCHFINKCQFCYQCVDCNECYEVFYGQNCQNSMSSWYMFDCKRCDNCIGCWNLRGKKYYILNKQATKQEFEETLDKIQNSYDYAQEFLKKFREKVLENAIHKSIIGENNENVAGNFIYNSKNVVNSFNIQKSEDIYYSDRTEEEKDQCFCSGVHKGELAYNSLSVDFSYNIICCWNGEHHTNTAYCVDCYTIKNCFGCVGLRQKEYCILNKQYSKEEYEELVPKIIDQMKKNNEFGNFFPISMNPFYFNKSVATIFYPLTKEEALKKGYKWKEDTDEKLNVEKTIPANLLPQNIKEIPDDVLNWAILPVDMSYQGISTNRPFIITKLELDFYRKYKLHLPRLHPDERYQNRFQLRTSRTIKLFEKFLIEIYF